MMIHWAGRDFSPCGERTRLGLPRTSCDHEVTCPVCKQAICETCRGTGLQLDDPFKAKTGPGPLEFNRCPDCKGSGLKMW